MNGPKPICGPKFQLTVAQVSSTESRLFLCLHLWMPVNSICQNLPCLLLVPLRETVPLKLAVACANVMVDIYKCITMARQDAVVQPYQFDPESIEAQSALYWPSLLKQSDVKWLAHIDKLTQTAAGTLSLKMKRSHCLFCCPVAGTKYRHWCWFLQPTTEEFACLALSDDIAKKLLAYHWTHRTSPRGWAPPLSDISYHHTEEASLWTFLLLSRNDRTWIWTAYRSAVLPVGGLQRPCRTPLISNCGSWRAQGGPVYICRVQTKHVFHNMGPLRFYGVFMQSTVCRQIGDFIQNDDGNLNIIM